MKDKYVLTKVKTAFGFTVTCMLLSIAAICFIQLWQRRGCRAQEGEEGWAEEAADALFR